MLTILFSCLIAVFSTEVVEKHNLSIQIEGLRETQGVLHVAVYNSKESFMKFDRSVASQSISPNLPITEIHFEDLPAGKYAITVFHDINMDEELNRYLFGIPKEPFGFSNNPKLISGPPGFKNTSFDLKNSTKITIELKRI